jgi:hypothetical protein
VPYGYIGSMGVHAGRRDEVIQILLSGAAGLRDAGLPETRAAIGRAMPMLTGEFTRQELTVVGGLGVIS